jgi:hypothetical protein
MRASLIRALAILTKKDSTLDRHRMIAVLRDHDPDDLTDAARSIVKAQGGRVSQHMADIMMRSYASMTRKASKPPNGCYIWHPEGAVKDPEQGALEEWKQLQTIIGRLDTLEFQHRGWLLVLLGGLIAAVLTKPSTMSPVLFLVVGLIIVCIFCFMEMTTRMPKRTAIDRARKVERILQNGDPTYKGPAIAQTISEGASKTLKDIKRELRIANVWAFYIPLAIVVALIATPSILAAGATVTPAPAAPAKTPSKPVEVTEGGWVVKCSDASDPANSAHGLPFMLFKTHVGGHFDTFIFSSHNVPKCAMWHIADIDRLAKEKAPPRDYEITLVQHMDDKGDFDGTWDLLRMRSLNQ